MTIDWSAFTPWSAAIGGVLIGLAVALFVLVNGRVAGISGIVGGSIPGPALVALGAGYTKAAVFVAAMLLGMGGFDYVSSRTRHPREAM